MTRLTLDISMSLDGFIAGPNQTVESPLGEGGEGLHEWIVRLAGWLGAEPNGVTPWRPAGPRRGRPWPGRRGRFARAARAA